MDIMESEILEFIEEFKKSNKKETEDLFLNGNCYYFAIILQERFNYCGIIMYIPIYNHFCYKIFGNMYDITGKIEKEEYINLAEPWSLYKNKDIKEETSLIVDCIMKLKEEKRNKIIP